PTLDFNQETSFTNLITNKPLEEIQAPTISFNPNFNPFEDTKSSSSSSSRATSYAAGLEKKVGIPQNWDSLYQITQRETAEQLTLPPSSSTAPQDKVKQFFQLHNRFIVSQIHSGFMLIDQQAAHERILFEHYMEQLEHNQGSSQQSLFPQTVELSAADCALMEDILPEIQTLGFQVRPLGKTTFIVDGIPADLGQGINETKILEQLLEDFKNNKDELQLNKRENLARSLAKNAAIKPGTTLDNQEMAELIDKLFATQSPSISIHGKPIVVTITLQELMERFNKN